MGLTEWIIVIGISLIVFIIIMIILGSILQKKQINKMYKEVEILLDKIVSIKPEDYSYTRVEKPKKKSDASQMPFDYVLESKKYRYHIKLISNIGNQEICVNNSVKWQLRKSFNDETLRFVENVEQLMRLDLPNSSNNKANKKLYIIYPNARSLLKYINECEMEFVHPHTDVYGTNIITYVALCEHMDLIKL